MKKNEEFELLIEDMSSEGNGIGKRDGFVWFVKDTVSGDRILASAMKMKKNYGFARCVRVLSPSPDRAEPPCTIAERCGGCQLQAMSYPAQLRFKSDKVYNSLLRIGEVEEELLAKIYEPIEGMEYPLRYRNKAQFPIARAKNGECIAGFYAGRTHSIIACEDCLLGVPENSILLKEILRWMESHGIAPYDEESGSGLVRHVLIRKGFRSGELMVCLVINGEELPHWEELYQRFSHALERTEVERFGRLCSLSYSVNREKTNVILGKRIVDLYGPGYIEDRIGEVRFRISPLSFYQVNPLQTEKMYATALEFAGLGGMENVWDLYCGIGTISLFLSQRAKKVYGVEIVPEAIRDAKQNAALNGIENVEFYVGAAEERLPEWHAAHPEEKIDVICVDPPRKGCDEKCLETISRMRPERIVYVSCDPATLARDIKYLRGQGYELKRVRAIDNFCQTVHVETVCLLVLRNPVTHINIDVDVEELVRDKRGQATYDQIREYVKEQTRLHVTNLNIAQIKRKCGIIERENYNLPKSEDSKQPNCTKEKENAIKEAFKHFGMI